MVAADEADALERLSAANASGPFRCAACCLEPTCRLACSRCLCLVAAITLYTFITPRHHHRRSSGHYRRLALTKESILYDLVGQRKIVLVDWWTLWLWTTRAKCSPWSSRASARRPFSCQVRNIALPSQIKKSRCHLESSQPALVRGIHTKRCISAQRPPSPICRHTAGQGWEAGRAAGGEAGQVWPPPVLVCQAYW